MSTARRLAAVQHDPDEFLGGPGGPGDGAARNTTLVGDLPLVFTLDEVAEVLRVGTDMVQSLVSARRIRSFRIGKYRRFYRKALIEYVERRDEEAD